jgi:hypothetical protein
MKKSNECIILTADNPTDSLAINDLRLQLKESKLIARRAAKRWSLNETGGGSVPR